MRSILDRMLPFVMLGIFFAIGVALLIMLANVIIIGALIGVVLFFINTLVEKWQGKPQQPSSGRIIEHE